MGTRKKQQEFCRENDRYAFDGKNKQLDHSGQFIQCRLGEKEKEKEREREEKREQARNSKVRSSRRTPTVDWSERPTTGCGCRGCCCRGC